MRVLLVLELFLGFCGVVVVGHSRHLQDAGTQVPLLEQAFVQDGPEELERKWSFEVGLSLDFRLREVCE